MTVHVLVIKKITTKLAYIGIMFFLFILFFCGYHFQGKAQAVVKTPTNQTVVATLVINTDFYHTSLSSVGTLIAPQSTLLTSQIAGIISQIYFQSGQAVTQGQLLVTLQSDDVAAQVKQAQATLLNDTQTYNRVKKLLNMHYIAAADVDNAYAKMQEDAANLAYYQAKFAQYFIRAPFSGVVGIRKISLGQFLKEGAAVVNVEQSSPMEVEFIIPEQKTAQLYNGDSIHFSVSAFPHRIFTGKVIATDQHIDSSSRGLIVRASVTNDDHALMSGMAAMIKVESGAEKKKIIIPQTALSYEPQGAVVYVLDKHQAVHARTLVLGEHFANNVVVLSGLVAGDEIVSEGQQKCHEGMSVVVKPDANKVNRHA